MPWQQTSNSNRNREFNSNYDPEFLSINERIRKTSTKTMEHEEKKNKIATPASKNLMKGERTLSALHAVFHDLGV